MASVQTDRISNPTVNSSLAIKAACRVATTADINSSLSGGNLGSGGGGLITIDGVALNAGDRVLVKSQADQTTNGIWVATATAWQRDVDANSNTSWLKGTVVVITDGTVSAGLWYELTTANPVTIGSSSLAFAVTSNPTVSVAMSPVVGAATLAQARTAMAVPGLGDNNTYTGSQTFNGTVAFNGADTDSAALTMSGAAINEARSTIASAATTNIGAAAGNYLQVTGVVTITAFDTAQAGTRRILEFAGALTLTNNASIILPGGANITTAAGDVAAFASEGAGVWRCTGYMKASGGTVIGTQLTNSLGADVAMNNGSNYFDGPTVAQGSAGTWFVSGTVTLLDTSAAQNYNVKLWDGTTVIASTQSRTGGLNNAVSVSLSGFISSPAGNLRISANAPSSTTSKILFNTSGNSKDSTITAIRIA